MKRSIFVVDDEEHIRELLEYNLSGEGYSVTTFEGGAEALAALKTTKPDLIILDLMMPILNGIELCKILRTEKDYRSIPVIMLTAKNEEVDKILGLELGADDYVTKPFSIRELLARVKAVLRRFDLIPQEEEKVLNLGDVVIYTDKREVYQDGKQLTLTYKEFEILKLLTENRGRVLSRDMLLNKIWGYDYYGETRTVDVHIRNLRRILGDENEEYIETIRGVGYKAGAKKTAF